MDIYDSRLSGNGWKVRLLLSQLGLPYRRHILNLADGDARKREFIQLNPLARVPVLVADDGFVLTESNAILLYLAEGSRLLPRTAPDRQRVTEWLFFEQFDHLRFMARPRYLVSIAKVADKHREELDYLRGFGTKALDAMERRLAQSKFIAGDVYTIADISLFPYTSMAEMGGYSLAAYPAVRVWLAEVERQHRFIPLISQ
ncbi:glutathione S-transferase family protein [Caenimonas soli]|uniref:glutathione S-transferase family protein n=1 Tax=Caenimonas soli TaxID=2735555 RepID=UPI00155454BB|nr:glutathione S-transferase family protein [Caenimonas soli]NPC58548.1 glutathione S-transferase family protein [Caenimonas soli]